MDIQQTKFELGHFQNTDINSVIEAIVGHSAHIKYRTAFQEAAEAVQDTDANSYQVYCLLSAIVSMHFKPSDTQSPYGPMFVVDDRRGFIPADLNDETLNALSDFYNGVERAELRARLADLVWLGLRKPEYAKDAVHAYIDAAKQVEDPEHWTICADYLERALRLSAMFRQQDAEPYNTACAAIKDVIDRHDGTDPKYLSLRLIRRLVEYSNEHVEGFYVLCVQIAKNAVASGDWFKAENAWEVAEECASVLGNQDKLHSALKEQAATYVLQAADSDSGMKASHWMQKAIEVNRKLPNSQSQNKALYTKLREYQATIKDEMSLIQSDAIDLSEFAKEACSKVRGHTFHDALFYLAFSVCRPLDYENLRKEAEADNERYVFPHIAGTVQYDKDGLIVAQVPPMSGLGDSDDDKALWFAMLRSAQFQHDMYVRSLIEPARREMLLEHNLIEEDFNHYVKNNPFIKPGHEQIFAKGLMMGLEGDFIGATHILVPQLEASFRHVLERHGVEPTSLNTQGIQEHIRLPTLLNHEKFAETFSNDVALDLQGLLIDRKYTNLRNEVSHGLMCSAQFYSASTIYLWWLTLRLCLTPFFTQWKSGVDREDGEQ